MYPYMIPCSLKKFSLIVGTEEFSNEPTNSNQNSVASTHPSGTQMDNSKSMTYHADAPKLKLGVQTTPSLMVGI